MTISKCKRKRNIEQTTHMMKSFANSFSGYSDDNSSR